MHNYYMRLFIFSLLFISAAPQPIMRKDQVAANYLDLQANDHFIKAQKFYNEQQWELCSYWFYRIVDHYAESPHIHESCFYLGMAQFHLGENAEANIYLSRYLKGESNPEHFREALETKFTIAERFRMGEKRRMYDSKKLPAWAGGEMMAIEIYDEITATIPCDELAIQSYYSKGRILFQIGMYNDAVSTLQTLIRRFPKNELSIESYILIEEIFAEQCRIEQQNTDILELARINLKHFEQDFPKEERLAYAQKLVCQIEETFATSLFNIGQLYERKGDLGAATIYYYQVLHQFPTTYLARMSFDRIESIAPKETVDKCFVYLNNSMKR